MRKILCLLGAMWLSGAALAGSSINPTVPATNAPLASGPIRTNFLAAYSDINNLLGQFAGVTSPPSPSRYQYWLDVSAVPAVLKIYDGAVWVSTAKLDASAHTWLVTGSYGGAPITPTYGGTGANFSAATGALSFNAGVAAVGILPAAFLPNPTTSTLGGVKSVAAVANNWVSYINGSGVPILARPLFSDLASTPTTLAGYGITDANPAYTGDVTKALNGTVLTMADTAVSAGSYGTATAAPSFTVDAKGRLTAAGSNTVTPAWGSITGTPTTLAGYGISTPISVANGGTGLATLTNHALQVGAGTSSPTQLGLGTSTTVLHGAAAGDPTWGAVALTADVSGILPAANGGTGIAYFVAAGPMVARTYTFPDSNATMIYSGGALGTPASGTLTNATGLPLGGLVAQAANTIIGNATSGSASPTALAIGSCSTSSSAVTWTTNSGWGCNTSIAASTATTATNVSGGSANLTGGSFASPGMTLANASYGTYVSAGEFFFKNSNDGVYHFRNTTDTGDYWIVTPTGLNTNAGVLFGLTAPTISSGFGTGASIASNNGATTFRVNVGTGGTASSGVIGLQTALTGWNCQVSEFNPSATALLSVTVVTASSASSVTVQNDLLSTGAATAWQASQVLIFNCVAY